MISDARLGPIEAALARGDIAGAATLAERALAAGEVAPMLLNLAAWARTEANDFVAAHALLRRALALAPGDPLILIGIGALLRREGRHDEALALLDRVVGETPGLLAAWLERGYVLEGLGRTRAAAASHARAARIDPRCAPALAGLAAAAAREHDVATARARATEALTIDRGNVIALSALAASDLADGEPARAVGALDALLARQDLPAVDRVGAMTLKADALDRLGAVDDAFAAYASANELYAMVHAPAVAKKPSHCDFIAHLDTTLATVDPAHWPALDHMPQPGEAASHAFLLGYPRSGTTLTETILASAPGVTTLEERPTLAAADHAFLLPHDGMGRLAALDAAAAAPFRAAYWHRVAAEGGGKGLFVDMDPLKSLRLPLIARLFPQARVLLMRRDPRDVVWSCFRQNFRFSVANYEFSGLERAARHYDATMRLIEHARAALPLTIHVIDYANLVTCFDPTTRALCGFLGIEWSSDLRRFADTARRRDVTTASAAQVRAGLYNGGDQWQRYARHLAPILPILAPWVERFGFSD